MPPWQSALKGTPCLAAEAFNPSTRSRVRCESASQKPGLEISRSVAKPQAVATGLPLKVPAWYTGPKGASCSMIARGPPNAASGIPPPITLPSTVMSGRKPGKAWAYTLCALPSATRKPVITSSKTSSAPCWVHSSRQRFMKGTWARTKFMLPAMGSIIKQAISAPCSVKASSSCAKLLYSSTSVSCTTSAGTPALVGLPKVARPEPALTSRASAWPW